MVAFILGAQEPCQVVAWAGFATVTKHVVVSNRERVFNPAALALLASVLLSGSGHSWWGALGDVPGTWARYPDIRGNDSEASRRAS
jgi:hypothetical protein